MAVIGSRCGLRPISRDMPDVFGRQRPPFFGKPAGRGHPVPPHRRRTHAAERRPRHQRPAQLRRVAAAQRIDQRQIAAHRIGEKPDRLGLSGLPVLRQLEPLEPRRRGQLRLDRRPLPLRAGARTSGASRARRAARSAPPPSSPRTRAPWDSAPRCTRPAPGWRSRPRQSRRSPPPRRHRAPRHQRDAAHGEKRHHRHERQGVANERGVLKQQMEDQIRDAERRHGDERSSIAHEQLHDPERREHEHDRRERGAHPRDGRTCASARMRPPAASALRYSISPAVKSSPACVPSAAR